jgi:homoserine kinase
MRDFIGGAAQVSVPATSANLGPGFDALGMALSLRDSLTASIAHGLAIEVTGCGAGEVPLDESHLVVQAMYAGFAAMRVVAPGLRLQCKNRVPHGMGLGSSSAALVGGLALARALVVDGEQRFSDYDLFELAAHMEGHPDNVGPAIYGGFVICGQEGDEFYAVPSPVDQRLSPVVFVPVTPLNTKLARGLLPTLVPHGEAAANASRAALLTTALRHRPDLMLWATRDYLHQEYRRQAMPDTMEFIDTLRADGIPAVVSGAGPSVLAWAGAPRRVEYGAAAEAALAATEVAARCPEGWTVHILNVEPVGVTASLLDEAQTGE